MNTIKKLKSIYVLDRAWDGYQLLSKLCSPAWRRVGPLRHVKDPIHTPKLGTFKKTLGIVAPHTKVWVEVCDELYLITTLGSETEQNHDPIHVRA